MPLHCLILCIINGPVSLTTAAPQFLLLCAVLIAAQLPWTRHIGSYLARRFYGLLYLVRGPQVIDHAYDKAKGQPFKVSTPSNDHLLVTSNDLIKELIHAPLEHLSLHAVAKEILQPKHTMYGFEWQDQRGVEGTGFVRALRSLLTSHLPQFQPDLERILNESMEKELGTIRPDGYAHAKLFPLMKKIVTKVNCFIFFGDELSRNTEFTDAALEFPQAVIFAAEFLRITPGFLRPFVASAATSRHKAAKTLHRYLVPIVEQRLAVRGVPGAEVPTDCIQWLIDTSPRKNPWTASRMVGEIMAVWFGSVHQLAMTTTYAIEDLCLHPEHIAPLREEAQELFLAEDSPRDVNRLLFLDSFIKESIRCSNSDAITCRRKALVSYTFGDGSTINKGDWVCVPQRAMMQDSTRYRDPQTFDGFRFARANAQFRHQQQQQQPYSADVPDRKESSLTDASAEWPIWGFGNTACPGRFYANLVTKLILIRILDVWECKMRDPAAPRSRVWRSSMVPRGDTIVMFRKRETAD
ncbi:hypothetical protein ACCO45_011875 [Purpureocillium lilacinum]|uniref:Uncharacterized protein n=1 Tax=Purpureocillium lilacinum TaxID=33203 RepID=A0ACC4DDM1_PURLI